MPYVRPRSPTVLSRSAKIQLVAEYFRAYREMAQTGPGEADLNVKLPRETFAVLLDEIGMLILDRVGELACEAGPVRVFLEKHAPPGELARLLPSEFRAFCLALNALKQWLAAEQRATDRYLLGGTALQTLRNATKTCTLTGEPVERGDMELHHPVRDGRPPIPVSKAAHAFLEKQTAAKARSDRANSVPADAMVMDDTAFEARLLALKRSRTWSWVMLRRGCLDLQGRPANRSTVAVGASSRSFARRAMADTGKDCDSILGFLDEREFGLER